MANIWIITEGKELGPDYKFLTDLIKKRNILPSNSYSIRTLDTFTKDPKISGGLPDIKKFLKNQVHLTPETTTLTVNKLALIFDCDEKNVTQRFNEITGCLKKSAFTIPSAVSSISHVNSDKVQSGVFLYPNSSSKGSLESVIWNYYKSKPSLASKTVIVDEYIDKMKAIDSKLNDASENQIVKIKLSVLSKTLFPTQNIKIFDVIDYCDTVFDPIAEFIGKFA